MDFAPMYRRPTGTLASVMSSLSGGFAQIEAQREPHAAFWDAWNRDALRHDGPLWVVLGDSSSQGIGSEDPTLGWVPQVLERLCNDTGDPWRVVNLSITGAQFSDIVTHELPRIDELRDAGHEAALTSLLAGANNLMAPITWPRAASHLRTVLDHLSQPAVVARVGIDSAGNSAMARTFNRAIESAARDSAIELFWPWSWPARDGMAEDKFHPSPKGYGYMVDVIYPAVRRALQLD